MDTYFATKSGKELGTALKEKVELYQREYQAHPVYDLQRRVHRAYHGLNIFGRHVSSDVVPGGDKGELAVASANLFKELLTHLVALTTSQRPDWEPQATNTDAKSISQTVLAANLLDTYLVQKGVEDLLRQCAEGAIRHGEDFLAVGWDSNAGEEYAVDPGEESPETEFGSGAAPEEAVASQGPVDPVTAAPDPVEDLGTNPATGAVIREGDLSFRRFATEDVIRDPFKRSWAECKWVILRERINRYDLAARYPEKEDTILTLSPESDTRLGYKDVLPKRGEMEDVSLFEFLHGPTPALPDGKQAFLTADGEVLFEGPLPYREVPVFRISAGEWEGSVWGYSMSFDLLGLQKTHQLMFSTIVTNLKNTGVSSIIKRPQSNLEFGLKNGMRVIEAAVGQEPAPLNLTAVPGDAYQLLSITEKLMESVSGMNSVVRGNPDAQIKSGAYAALIQQQAITFTGHLQASYTRTLEQVGTAAIRILRDFASTERVAAVVGKSGQAMLKEFTGDDLAQVDRVTVQVGNPMTRTQAGRLELANMLLQLGKNPDSPLKSTQDLLAVLTSGRLDVATEDQTRQQILIRRENELLAEGRPVRALVSDNHRFHIQQHLAELDSPEVREDQARTDLVLDHVQEHINLAATMHPLLAELTGQPMGAPPSPPPGGGGPPMPAPPELGPGGQVVTGQPQLPQMPVNPAPGEEWNPEDGGAGLPQ
jgi:hypothetical protein